MDIISFKRGSEWSLVELNKILAVSALTITLLSYIPHLEHKHRDLIKLVFPMILVHWAYSMNKYFGFSIKRVLDSRGDMKLSLISGMATMAAFALHYLGNIKAHHFMMLSLLGSTCHYIFMKYSQQGRLDLKPMAYLPLALAGYAVYYQLSRGNFKI